MKAMGYKVNSTQMTIRPLYPKAQGPSYSLVEKIKDENVILSLTDYNKAIRDI